MLHVKRMYQYLNTQHAYLNDEDFKNGVNTKEIERIILHDGTNILSHSRWIEDLKGHSHDYITLNVNAKRKNAIDLSEKAFVIKIDYEYSTSRTTSYDLYLHIDLFNFDTKENIKYNEMMYKTYIDIEKDVKFETMTKLLRKESTDTKTLIYSAIKELSAYNIDKLEKDINNLIGKWFISK